jgi:hypothetical protein
MMAAFMSRSPRRAEAYRDEVAVPVGPFFDVARNRRCRNSERAAVSVSDMSPLSVASNVAIRALLVLFTVLLVASAVSRRNLSRELDRARTDLARLAADRDECALTLQKAQTIALGSSSP